MDWSILRAGAFWNLSAKGEGVPSVRMAKQPHFADPHDTARERSPLFLLYRLLKPVYRRVRTPAYIVSFPKSGRTWVRVFVAKYCSLYYGVPMMLRLELPPYTFNPRVWFAYPYIHMTHVGLQDEQEAGGRTGGIARFVKNHRDATTLLIVRDPRDVVVSSYHHRQKRKPTPETAGMALSDYVRHERYGIASIIEFMNAWLAARDRMRHFTIMRYEDMRANPEEAFQTILTFFAVPLDESCFREALAFSSFDNMRAMEQGKGFSDKMLQPADPHDTNSYQVRRGKVGGYRDELTEADQAYCDIKMRSLDAAFGYRVDA